MLDRAGAAMAVAGLHECRGRAGVRTSGTRHQCVLRGHSRHHLEQEWPRRGAHPEAQYKR